MTSAWFLGATHSVPQTENEVRSTVEPVRTDPETAVDETAPEWNEQESDDSGQLVGLTPRVVGSFTVPSEKSVPPLLPLATDNHNAVVDNQVATSGTAAARESQGQRGHGTMQYEIGIDPLNPAQRYGNEFFIRDWLSANEGGGDYMSPVANDNWAQQVLQTQAESRSREAARSSQLNAFFS